RAARALGHGFHQAAFLGEPVDDQAGIRQPGEADDDGPRGLHPGIFGKPGSLAMQIPPENPWNNPDPPAVSIAPNPASPMKFLIIAAFSAFVSLASAEEGAWTSLFNGKDLTGWTPKIRGCKAGE